jgi:hypothetical protein
MSAEVTPSVKATFPVAKPAATSRPQPPIAPLRDEADEEPVFTRDTLKSWGTSISFHAVLLIVMGCWYFAPKLKPQAVIDTRLAGSENGVEDGLTLTGGLNAEIAMPEGAQSVEAYDKTLAAMQPLDLLPVDPNTKNTPGAEKATGGGGLRSNNPGAGDGDGFGLARFGSGGESIRGVQVKVGDPQFTLIWDTGVDLDLHVVEPGGKEIYWEDPKGKPGLGGELDVDNTKGFGPENIYWLKEDGDVKEPGPGPAGEYRWWVAYWGGFGGIPQQTHWKVRIKHAGKVTVVTGKLKALGEKSRVHTLRVDPGRAP